MSKLFIEEMDEDEGRKEHNFVFHSMPEAQYQSVGNASVQPLLNKWGFADDMAMCTFRVEQQIDPDNLQAFLEAFFRDRNVLGWLHSRTRLRVVSPEKVGVRWQKLSTQAVSMAFLNKFEEVGAISQTGHIRGRVEEDFEGVPVVDLIRETILMEDSELYEAFSEKERKEFLFRIFSHVVFGGASNQYEDHVEEYFRVTKQIYKDLLTVRRNDVGDVEVVSSVLQVHSLGHGGQLFPKESLLNFCYLIFDPMMRHVRVWYFGYRPIW